MSAVFHKRTNRKRNIALKWFYRWKNTQQKNILMKKVQKLKMNMSIIYARLRIKDMKMLNIITRR